jgi:hypothetical protein
VTLQAGSAQTETDEAPPTDEPTRPRTERETPARWTNVGGKGAVLKLALQG